VNNYIFESQFKEEIHKEAIKMGFKIKSSKSFKETLLDFLTVRMKFIDAKPRIALMSPPLLNELFTHHKRKEIEIIFNIAKKGGKSKLESRGNELLFA